MAQQPRTNFLGMDGISPHITQWKPSNGFCTDICVRRGIRVPCRQSGVLSHELEALGYCVACLVMRGGVGWV